MHKTSKQPGYSKKTREHSEDRRRAGTSRVPKILDRKTSIEREKRRSVSPNNGQKLQGTSRSSNFVNHEFKKNRHQSKWNPYHCYRYIY